MLEGKDEAEIELSCGLVQAVTSPCFHRGIVAVYSTLPVSRRTRGHECDCYQRMLLLERVDPSSISCDVRHISDSSGPPTVLHPVPLLSNKDCDVSRLSQGELLTIRCTGKLSSRVRRTLESLMNVALLMRQAWGSRSPHEHLKRLGNGSTRAR